jgi:outer membrane protein OmpA-like peptidoglycan-associated protein
VRATPVEEHPAYGYSSAEQEEALSEDGRTLATLRSLLLGPEQHNIRALRDRLENFELRTEDVSAVVAEAIRLRHTSGGSEILIEALTPSILGALRESARKDPRALSEAFFPVVGPAIRRSLTQYIQSLLESFNNALEHSLSLQGMRWRLEALRTGKTFAEVVVLHSLIYRVEQIFLIHDKTGLVLCHAVAPGVSVQDPTLVSGMLSAIQDFVRDSFNTPRDEIIDSMHLGDLRVWVEPGPHAILAAVIRGHPPETLRPTLREALEKVHQNFGSALELFDGDSSPFAGVRDDLALCLDSRYQESAQTRAKPYFLIALALLLTAAAGWAWAGFSRQQRWKHFVDKLAAQPGIVVTSFTKESQYQIRGLRDPLAVEPSSLLKGMGLDPKRVQFRWAPYYSLDDAIVLKRVATVLQPPTTVTLSLESGNLHVQGEAPAGWIEDLKTRAILVPGVRSIDASGLRDVKVAGLERERKAIEAAVLLFEANRAEMAADQRFEFEKVAQAIKAILAGAATPVGRGLVIEIVGHSDNSGTEAWNRLLSERRAGEVARELIRNNIEPKSLVVRGVGYSQRLWPSGMGNDPKYDRSVTFRVVIPPASDKQ